MTTFVFDTTMFAVLVEEYPDLPPALAQTGAATFLCSDAQFAALPADPALQAAFVTAAVDAMPHEHYDPLLQILASVRPSRGDAPQPDASPADDRADAQLIALCMEHGHVLVCGRRAVAETAWKFGVPVKNLREYLKAVGDARHRSLDEQTGR